MCAQSITVRPKSVDEIRQAFTNWWGQHHRRLAPDIRFSRPSHSETWLRMWSRLARNVRLQLHNKELSCELAGGRKFHLVLDDFDVKAEVDGNLLLFEFKLSEAPARPLKERLTAIEKTKHPVFLSRALNALTGLAQVLPKERIDKASEAPKEDKMLGESFEPPSLAPQLQSP